MAQNSFAMRGCGNAAILNDHFSKNVYKVNLKTLNIFITAQYSF